MKDEKLNSAGEPLTRWRKKISDLLFIILGSLTGMLEVDKT